MSKQNLRWKIKFKDLLYKANRDGVKEIIKKYSDSASIEPTFVKIFYHAIEELLKSHAFSHDLQKAGILEEAIKIYENINEPSKDQTEASVPVGLANNTSDNSI